MIHQMFSVYDSKTQAYLPPFYLQTAPQALRAIADCVNDKAHQFGLHPEDYTLFHLGTFDDTSGLHNLVTTPEPLAKGIELIQEPGS